MVCDYEFNDGLSLAALTNPDIDFGVLTFEDRYSVIYEGDYGCGLVTIPAPPFVLWFCGGDANAKYEGDSDIDHSWVNTVPEGCDSRDTDWDFKEILKQK